MSFGVSSSGIVVKANRRFLDDAAELPDAIARKVGDVVRILHDQGTRYPRLHTRQLQGNPNPAFKLMDVDYSYRIVAAVDGHFVFLEKVGQHDVTERWGETATLRQYQERIVVDPAYFARERRHAASEATAEMFDMGGPSLAKIAASDAVADVLTDCLDGVLEGWVEGTIEDWMIFLSPVQRRAVDRAVGGPSRVTGGPGTGKTVVGLHRAVKFARELEPGQRILLTSYVNTVPPVLSGLFESLAPELLNRVDFRTIHWLAGRQFPDRVGMRFDSNNAESRFGRVLASRPERLRQLRVGARLTNDYLWEEITRVIEGRGIDTLPAYLALQRHGRRRQLPALLRSLIWEVYEEYRAACEQGDPVADWDWMLRLALERLRDHGPRDPRYAAVIVDEAQDISEVGLKLLLEVLQGGSRGRLMLIGDSGQRIYPGGYRLSELGLEIRGRSFPLTVCYRSTDEIMQAVGALGRYLSPEEFGEDGLRSLATSTVRNGPRPTIHVSDTGTDECRWVLDQLDPDDPTVDATAILTFSNSMAEAWRTRLADAGIGSVRLEDYRGRSIPGVKVGTYHRGKGLEFKRVFLPGLDASYPMGDRNDADEIVEKGSLLYVAMSRARDELHLSYVGTPSMFLEGVSGYCDLT